MKYLATYYNNGKPICTTIVQASGAEEAEEKAEYKIMCLLENVKYDHVEVAELTETEQ